MWEVTCLEGILCLKQPTESLVLVALETNRIVPTKFFKIYNDLSFKVYMHEVLLNFYFC